MKQRLRLLCLLTALTGLSASGGIQSTGWAQDNQTEKQSGEVRQQDDQAPPTLADQVKGVITEFNTKTSELRKAIQDASGEDARELTAQLPKLADVANQLMALVAKEPNSDAAWEAYFFIARSSGRGELFNQAADALITNFVNSEKFLQFLPALNAGTAETNSRLEKVIEMTENATVRGRGMFQYAELLSRKGDEASEARAIELYEAVLANHAAIPMGRGRTLGEIADDKVFALKHLKIGKVAPDIEGHDLDEVSFKLSDYRGKVVVIDFWGDW